MSNASATFHDDDQSAETWQKQECDGLHKVQLGDLNNKMPAEEGHGVGLHTAAQHGDLSSKKAMEKGHDDGLHRDEHGDLSSKKAMEEGDVDGLIGAEHGDLSSKKAMEEGNTNGLRKAEHGDLSRIKTMEVDPGDGYSRAEHGDLSSKKAMEAGQGNGLFGAYHGDISSKRAMEEGHGYGLHSAEQGELSSMKAVEEGHGDGLHSAEHGELSSMKAMEEGHHADGLHRGEPGDLSKKKAMEEGYGDGSHRDLHSDRGIKMALKEGHGDGKAETETSHDEMEHRESTSPEPEMPAYVHTSHKSVFSSSAPRVHTNLSAFGTMAEHHNESVSSHGASETHANLPASVTLVGTHHGKIAAAPYESGDDGTENMAARDRSREHSHAAYSTRREGVLENDSSDDSLAECTHENGTVYGTLGEDAHESMPAYYDTSGQQGGRNIFATPDLYMTDRQIGRYPYETMLGGYAQGKASLDSPTVDASVEGDKLKGGPARFPYEDSVENADVRGNVYDHTTTKHEFGANAHEKLTAYKAEGEDVKVSVNHAENSRETPSWKNFATKSGSRFSGSSYYTKQSGSMKNLGLMLRFAVAVFSLIAFSVMISTTEKRVAAGSTFQVKFSDFQAYNYLVAINLLSFLYSSGQLILLAQPRSSSIFSSPFKWGASVYLCDQILAYLMVSSSSSAATASELSRNGLHNIWPPACSTWKLSYFCSKADVAVVISFGSSLCMLLSSFASGYHLSKLLAE